MPYCQTIVGSFTEKKEDNISVHLHTYTCWSVVAEFGSMVPVVCSSFACDSHAKHFEGQEQRWTSICHTS